MQFLVPYLLFGRLYTGVLHGIAFKIALNIVFTDIIQYNITETLDSGLTAWLAFTIVSLGNRLRVYDIQHT